MDLPPPLEVGPPSLRKAFNGLRDCLRAWRIIRGENYEVDENDSGSQLLLGSSGGASGSPRAKLQIFKIDDTHIGISAGKVAELVEDGTSTWEVSGTGEIWAQVDVAAADTVSNLVIFDNGMSGTTPDTTRAYTLIGTYATASGVLTVTALVGGSQGLTICRSYPDNFVVPEWTLV